MSDEPVSQPEDTVSRDEFNTLQEQLKATRVERDREKFEKAEIVAKANAYARERDDAKKELATVLSERDQMIGDIVANHEKAYADLASQRDQLAKEKSETESRLNDALSQLVEANRRAEGATAEATRLKYELEVAPSAEPLKVLWKVVYDYAKFAHDWLRAKIPAESPILPWFDKAVALSLQAGCTAFKLSRDFITWATPKVIDLSKQGMAKVEEMMAKK